MQLHTVALQLHYRCADKEQQPQLATGCVTSCPVESGHKYARLCPQAAYVLFLIKCLASDKLCSAGSTHTQPTLQPS